MWVTLYIEGAEDSIEEKTERRQQVFIDVPDAEDPEDAIHQAFWKLKEACPRAAVSRQPYSNGHWPPGSLVIR